MIKSLRYTLIIVLLFNIPIIFKVKIFKILLKFFIILYYIV